ncbi:MAG: class I mannose-6-phosphate isomerase [Sphingobium sp.]|nr:class I mannose-6-phosphate isomerase [Sphingobium sp.]
MSAIRLHTKYVEKPWGRTDLPPVFGDTGGRRIGEIWFDGPEGRHPPLLVKYLFTSEKLSIQVHPNDAEARERGLSGGKSECWYVLEAQGDARLGIGTTRPLVGEELRAASLNGEIEALMDWKPVSPGSFFYIEAGTVHAIGGGVTVIEVQQNNDVTYRLYDYGRPRELHLDEGVAVSKARPYPLADRLVPMGSDELLVDGATQPFALRMESWPAGRDVTLGAETAWFIPVSGAGRIDDQAWRGSECWLVEGGARLVAEADSAVLVATIA